ncbi:hypothetical protein IJ425_05305 [bacterium]|nr:hypothetical protein [bacterium]
MKKILCFGDSNTFGFNPENGTRYNESQRWSGILKNEIKNCEIKEEGLNNRTCFSSPENKLNTIKTIEKYLDANYDLIIFQIGINDLQFIYNTKIQTLEEKLIDLAGIVLTKSPNTKMLFLCPNIISENILNSYFNCLFNEESIKKSTFLRDIFILLQNKTKADVIFLEYIAKTSAIDGLHFDSENHKIIADVLKKYCLEKLFK